MRNMRCLGLPEGNLPVVTQEGSLAATVLLIVGVRLLNDPLVHSSCRQEANVLVKALSASIESGQGNLRAGIVPPAPLQMSTVPGWPISYWKSRQQ